jgi:hypothetical protein
MRSAGPQAVIESLEQKDLIRTGPPKTDGDGNVTQAGFLELTPAGLAYP